MPRKMLGMLGVVAWLGGCGVPVPSDGSDGTVGAQDGPTLVRDGSTPGAPDGGFAGCGVAVAYLAVDDTMARQPPALPVLGGAGYQFTDPTFGSRMVRVTDASTRAVANVPYRSTSSSQLNEWNADSTRFIVEGPGPVPFQFDAASMKATPLPDPKGGGALMLQLASGASFSFRDPDVLYGVDRPTQTLVAYRFSTATNTPLFALATLVPGYSGHDGEVTEDIDDRLLFYFGGPNQNSDLYILLLDQKNGQYALMNTQTSTVKALGETNASPLNTPMGFTIHRAILEKGGRYVQIEPGDANKSPYIWIWDTQTNQVAPMTTDTGGHAVGGFGWMFKHGLNGGDCSAFVRRPEDPSLLTQQTKVVWTPPQPTPQWEFDYHASWNNAQPDAFVPVLMATDRAPGMLPWRAWDNEVIAAATDGSAEHVWRFAHHRSVVNNRNFWDSSRGNVSQDGRYYLFTSNWENTLGTAPDGTHRQDSFVVELKAACP